MNELPYILFCESVVEPTSVDEDYQDEFLAAKRNGFKTLIFNFDDLVADDSEIDATKRIKPANELTKLIYRGWMLTPKQYLRLYNDLLSKNYQLINTTQEYQNCHYLPDSLKFIEKMTPKTVFQKMDQDNSLDQLLEKTNVFGEKAVILKDYVKSEKHDWETACYVENASNRTQLRQSITNLLKLRGNYLNEGIVVREFIELNDQDNTQETRHSKSGMPLKEEYRLFFYDKKLLVTYDYWEEGDYNLEKPDTTIFEALAKTIESNFFSMDIARQKNGEIVIIELGDGQVAGLPDKTERDEFYKRLRLLV